VRRLAVLIGLTASAHADPRDVFGLPAKAPQTVDCRDGKDFGCAAATDPLADGTTFGLTTWLDARYLLSLPVGDATHDQVAHYALGVGRDEVGLVIGGATGLENRWTIEGAPTESVRTGAAETRVPLAFLDGILVTAGGFAARDRVSTGGTIEARLRKGGAHHEVEAYAWLTTIAPSRHADIASDTYQVRRLAVDPANGVSAAVVATGPLGDLLGGRAWYAAGIAPTLRTTDFSWTAGRLVDRDQDGVPDGLPGLPEGELIEKYTRTPLTYFVPAMARAGLDRGPHHVELSLLGSVSQDVFYLADSTLQAGGVNLDAFIGDAIANYRAEWPETKLTAQLAWHHVTRTQSARDPAAANMPQLNSAYIPSTLPDDPVLAGQCDDTSPGDPYPNIPNCPVPAGFFASAGAGELINTTSDRPSITADIAHRIDNHVVRAGATGEDARYVSTSRFTGGELDFSLFPGHISQRQFLDPNLACSADVTQPCATSETSVLTYRTRYTAAYVEDTWHPEPGITVDGGLRWELMWVGPVLHFSDELAPRFGASWDPLGGGRSRVWTSAGRSFALLPAGLGSTLIGTDRTVDNITSPFGVGRFIETGAPIKVAADVEPIAQDELTLGAEVALARAVKLRGWLQGRWLERGITTTQNGFDNPGRDGSQSATRDTELLAVELATAPAANTVLRVGYLYAMTLGSYVGPYDPREGAILYASTDFQVQPLNLVGPLPTDLGHRLYFEASRRGRVGDVGLAIATRFTVASGRPRDVLGEGDSGLIYLIPRGMAGRGPMQSQANIRLAASWRGFDLTLDLINLFDRRTATNVDPVYAGPASIVPIQGGCYGDLVFLRDVDGAAPTRRTTYDLASAFQSPFSAVLGLHRAF
jgi:hypothetical protein